MLYELVVADSKYYELLNTKINAKLADGWELYGSPFGYGFRVDNSAQPSLLKSLGRAPEDLLPFFYPGGLTIIPVTSYRFWGRTFPFNGGLFCSYVPISLQIKRYQELNEKGIPINYYCHPYEFCPQEINRQAWKYGSIRAAFYGIHFGRYRKIITRLADYFKFAPLKTAYHRFLSDPDQQEKVL